MRAPLDADQCALFTDEERSPAVAEVEQVRAVSHETAALARLHDVSSSSAGNSSGMSVGIETTHKRSSR